jgi:predicted acetyltransferase
MVSSQQHGYHFGTNLQTNYQLQRLQKNEASQPSKSQGQERLLSTEKVTVADLNKPNLYNQFTEKLRCSGQESRALFQVINILTKGFQYAFSSG